MSDKILITNWKGEVIDRNDIKLQVEHVASLSYDYKLILRVPNPLNVTDIKEAPFYEEFIGLLQGQDNSTHNRFEYLREEIDAYVRDYGLYCDSDHTMPMMYLMIIPKVNGA